MKFFQKMLSMVIGVDCPIDNTGGTHSDDLLDPERAGFFKTEYCVSLEIAAHKDSPFALFCVFSNECIKGICSFKFFFVYNVLFDDLLKFF